MNKYKDLLKNTAIFALGNVGSKVIFFLLVPLYTNFLTPEEYGTADLIFTISQLLLPVISIVIFDAVIRFGLSKYEKPQNVLLCGYIVLLFGSIVTLIITPFFSLYKVVSKWKWYMAGYVIGSCCLSIQMNYLKVKENNIAYSIISIFQTLCMASFNVVFLVIFKSGVKGYLLSNILAVGISIIVSLFAGHILKDLREATFDKELLFRMVKYSFPLILNNISWWVVQSSDRLMVQWMMSSAALGIYTVAAKIPSLINVMTNVFSQAWGLSSVKEIESTNDNNFYSNVFEMYVFISFGLCIFAVSIIKPFMAIYVGSSFGEAWKYIPLLLCAASFASVAYYYGSLYGALKKSVNNMITTVVAAIVNIVINYLLINSIGIYGAVVGTLASYMIMAHVRMIDVGKYIKIDFRRSTYLINCTLILLHSILVTLDRNIVVSSIITLLIYLSVNKSMLIKIWEKFVKKK